MSSKRPETAPGPRARRPLSEAIAARQRAQMVTSLRGLQRLGGAGVPPRVETGPPVVATVREATDDAGDPAGPPATGVEHCDLCGTAIAADHRHLLALGERRIACSCEACWAMRAGEGDWRPVGSRTLWLEDLQLPDDIWAGFQIPIGLAFLMASTVTGCVVAMYPSPAGATESELHFDSWHRLVELNPVLAKLEPDVEGLIINRLAAPPIYAIAPIDRCYALTGAIKARWEGISGGSGVEAAVASFFDGLRAEAQVAALR